MRIWTRRWSRLFIRIFKIAVLLLLVLGSYYAGDIITEYLRFKVKLGYDMISIIWSVYFPLITALWIFYIVFDIFLSSVYGYRFWRLYKVAATVGIYAMSVKGFILEMAENWVADTGEIYGVAFFTILGIPFMVFEIYNALPVGEINNTVNNFFNRAVTIGTYLVYVKYHGFGIESLFAFAMMYLLAQFLFYLLKFSRLYRQGKSLMKTVERFNPKIPDDW